MKRTFIWAPAALAAATSFLQAEDPLRHALVHGVFKPSPEAASSSGPAIHPLEPAQKLASVEGGHTFRIQGRDVEGAAGIAFPILASAGSKDPVAQAEFKEEAGTFTAAVDLTGTGVSDLLVARQGQAGWKVFSNGQRMKTPIQAFLVGFVEKDADAARAETIPADLRDFTVDNDLLAATGDFLGNGTEQLAYTRPGASQIWVVGAHGVTTLRADLKGLEPCGGDHRTHFLFPYKATHKVQRTRLAYYRMGRHDMIRLVPKGMEYHAETVPLKGHWERLNQEVLDWPTSTGPAPSAPGPEEGKGPAK